MKKVVRLSLRDFALPSPRTGSIDSHSGYGRASQEGIEIHQAVQRARSRDDDAYEAEVRTEALFETDEYDFRVEGRIDGLFRREIPHIEEIKSTFNLRELSRALEENPFDHPYLLQLRCYGYFFERETGVRPTLSLHLVSTRNRETMDLPIAFEAEAFAAWRERRLAELVEDARRAERRSERRRKTELRFPFERPRAGQLDLVGEIERTMGETAGAATGARLLLQAPTGLGKTVGVLYPSLKEAFSRGQRVVYVTPKNSQHAVAEDAAERIRGCASAPGKKEAGLKSLTLTAKGKICPKAEPLCNSAYCEYARDYYGKVAEHGLLEKLAQKKKLSARTFTKLAKEYEVCPFELQLDAAPEVDVVVCDYNYVFAPRSAFGRMAEPSFAQDGEPNLVIDEAHNLPGRTMDYFSPSLSGTMLERLRDEFRDLPRRFADEAEALLDASLEVLRKVADGVERAARIDPPLEPFTDQEILLRAFLSRYLESDAEIRPGDPVLRLCFAWSGFTEMLVEISAGDHPEFFLTVHPSKLGEDEGSVKITCCDASKRIADSYARYRHVVGFSATLKPFEYYARLSGLDPATVRTAEFPSPFDPENRKLLIIPQVSTKYSERERNYPRIADAIGRIAALRPGNYLAFFPSFDFLHRVARELRAPAGFRVVLQEREMRRERTDAILESLRAGEMPTILFGVQGGVFSEGIDYPGAMAIGAFVVGPPLPSFDLEREGMRQYYQENYGAGFEYAYTYPAMAKAVQSAGRVIRGETDRGVVVLLDRRFVENGYARTMPGDWFRSSPAELVSNSILGDIRGFWSKGAEAAGPGLEVD